VSSLALTWTDHRRTRELCAALNVPLLVISTTRRGALRYLELAARTCAVLAGRRPQLLLVQNPSLVLAALALLLRPLWGYRLIVDAHNEAVTPFIHRQRAVLRLARWVLRRADLTIVTNRQLARQVEAHGGVPFVLPDRIPVPPAAESAAAQAGLFRLVLIATFAPDEPIAAIFEAVQGMDLELYVTGRASAAARAAAPANAHFTGYLPEADYWALLRSSDAVIDLTLMEDCLVCGAYEALALGKPMLLSGNAASRELFGAAAVFTDNSAADIRRALGRLREQAPQLAAAAKSRRAELAARWDAEARELGRRLPAAAAAPA